MSATPYGPGADEALTQELIKRIGTLREFVAKRTPRRDRALVSVDDVLQELWVAAQRGLASFRADGPGALDRWLHTMANSILCNHVRAAQRIKRGGKLKRVSNVHEKIGSYCDLFARVAGRGVTPSKEARVAEAGHAVMIALRQLSDARQQAVRLIYIEGVPLDECAARMGRTAASARSLAYQGLRDLREILGDAADYFSDVPSAEPTP